MMMMEWQKVLVEAGELYRVGGAVRDELLGLDADAAEDVDFLVRAIEPGDLESLLEPLGRLELVGKSFGVYKFRPAGDERVFDIAYPRKEQSTGIGHRDFRVRWDPQLPVEIDLARRDFTMNAIAQPVAGGEIIDPCNGRQDIRARRLRMIFDEAFEEDPLRILRGIRFGARFGLEIESGTHAAMGRSAGLLSSLSSERVQDELTHTLTQCARPSQAFEIMREAGALSVILPELDRAWGVTQNEFHPDDVYWHSLKSCDAAPREDLLVRWAALLHDLGKVDKKQSVADEDGGERVVFYGHEKLGAEIAHTILHRLRYSNEFVTTCSHLVAHHMFHYEPEWTGATVRRFIRRVGEAHLDALFRLREADCGSRDLSAEIDKLNALRERVRDELDQDRAFKIEDLAIGGLDVMKALDIASGARVGEVLEVLLEAVIDDPSRNERVILLEIVRERFG